MKKSTFGDTSSAATLGESFQAYLDAQSSVDADNAKLTADQESLAANITTFAADLSHSGVAAVLAPGTGDDGTTAVAIAQPDGKFTVIKAAAPSTPIKEPAPAPEPAGASEPFAPEPEPAPTPTDTFNPEG